jgi:hypothetical protein
MSPLLTQPRGDTDFGWRFLTPLLLGSALNPINSSVIATALIPIGKAFGAVPAQTGLLGAAQLGPSERAVLVGRASPAALRGERLGQPVLLV